MRVVRHISTFLSIVVILGLLAGCHSAPAQVTSGPQTYTCQAAVVNGNAYTPINPSTNITNPPVTGQSLSDTPGAGVWCYIVQAWLTPNASVPSNVAQITATSTDPVINLSWVNPNQTQTGVTYIVSRSPAIANSPLLAPTQNAPTAVVFVDHPLPVLAKIPAPINLKVVAFNNNPR